MKDKAIHYLMKDLLLHIGMIEPINRNTADILYADSECVLMKEQRSGAYMISVDSLEKGQEILKNIPECNLIVAHQPFIADYIRNKFGLKDTMECIQAVYTSKNKLDVRNNIEIKQLNLNHMDTVLEHYNLLSDKDIQTLLKDGSMFGGYKEESLVGFIGMHLEGSIGLLEIFPEYRHQGCGTVLESYMANKILAAGGIPYAQVEITNETSMALQKKLGFQLSESSIYWMF
jgi:Acetyltransferases